MWKVPVLLQQYKWCPWRRLLFLYDDVNDFIATWRFIYWHDCELCFVHGDGSLCSENLWPFTNYYVIFNNPRDKYQVEILAR